MDTTAYAKALSTLPRLFDQIARRDAGYLIERLDNGGYVLWRSEYGPHGAPTWTVAGGISHDRGFWDAAINQPYNPETDSDSMDIYFGASEQAAVDALWEARHDAW